MNKITKIILITSLSLTTVGTGIIWWKISQTGNLNQPCAFCDPQVLATHTFYEDPLVIGLCDHRPIQPGHCLAIIKRHVKTFEGYTDDELTAIGRLLKKINIAIQKIYGPSSYIILQKNGWEVGQTVPHVHFHYIPKKKTGHRTIPLFGLFWSFIKRVFKKPITQEELIQNVTLMKQQFENIKQEKQL
jgi:diadenosine tetraphosphate (Ap4A) HIT family hydrolase